MANKRVLGYTAALAIILLALFLLWEINQVVVIFLFSIFLGAAFRPLADFLRTKTVLQTIFYIISILLIVAGLVGLLYLAFMRMSSELNLLVNTVSNLDKWYLPMWVERLGFTRTLIELLPPPGEVFDIATSEGGRLLIPAVQSISVNAATILSSVVIIIFLSIYWTSSREHFERLWLSLLSVERRQKVRTIWREVDENLGAYGRYLFVKFFITWLVVSVGVFYLRSPYPVLLGLVVAVANLIPIVGMVVALLFTLAIGLLSSILFYPWLLLYVFFALTALSIFLWPRLYQQRWDAPILRLLFLLIIGETLGFPWLILAAPLANIVQTIWTGISPGLRLPRAVVGIDSLKEHQERLAEVVREVEDCPAALTNNLNRLDELLEKADHYLDNELNQPA